VGLLVSGSFTYYCYGSVNGDLKYKSNKNGKYLNQTVEEHLKVSGVYFAMAEVSRKYKNFKYIFWATKYCLRRFES